MYCLHIIFTFVFCATQVRIIYPRNHKGNAIELCNIRCDFALQLQSVQSIAAISDMAKNTNRRIEGGVSLVPELSQKTRFILQSLFVIYDNCRAKEASYDVELRLLQKQRECEVVFLNPFECYSTLRKRVLSLSR